MLPNRKPTTGQISTPKTNHAPIPKINPNRQTLVYGTRNSKGHYLNTEEQDHTAYVDGYVNKWMGKASPSSWTY